MLLQNTQDPFGTAMSERPKVIDRRLAARTGIFEVEEVDLLFANGARRRFERIRGGPGSVLIVPVRGDGTLLLTREYAAGTDRYEVGFPRGLIDPGEDPFQAANRELQEEVGFAAGRLDLLRTVSIAPGYIEHRTHILLARELRQRTAEGDEPEPIEVLSWPLEDVDGLLAMADFSEARSALAVFLVLRFLGGAPGTAALDRCSEV
jgi:ADP-ribose diphosphatase